MGRPNAHSPQGNELGSIWPIFTRSFVYCVSIQVHDTDLYINLFHIIFSNNFIADVFVGVEIQNHVSG